MNAVADRSRSLIKAAAISSCGAIDLSHEMIHRDGFKSLSWWQERGTWEVHAFLAVGIPTRPLMQVEGITPVLQFSDWVPWLDLKAIADGDIQSMDVFADNAIDLGCADYAGVYLGSMAVIGLAKQEETAHQILARGYPGLAPDAERLLWNLWRQAPYVYPPGTPYSERFARSAHQITRNADVTNLTAKSVTLV